MDEFDVVDIDDYFGRSVAARGAALEGGW